MASPLTTWMDTLETTWQAVTPTSDSSSSVYRFIDDFVEERGNGQHRQLIWGRPQRAAINAEHYIQVEWQIDLHLFLHRTPPGVANRTQEAFHKAIAHEVSDLVKSYSNVTSWGASTILEAILDDVSIEDTADISPVTAGGIRRGLVARITFPFRVTCVEV